MSKHLVSTQVGNSSGERILKNLLFLQWMWCGVEYIAENTRLEFRSCGSVRWVVVKGDETLSRQREPGLLLL